MAELGLQGDVQLQVAMGEFQKLSHEPSESFLCVFQFEGEPGSWSRGYDVALTWRRSQVQFLPSPPDRTYHHLSFYKGIRESNSTLPLILLSKKLYVGYIRGIVNMYHSTWTYLYPLPFHNS